MIKLTLENLEDFTRWTAFLGTGGGGDPYIGKLMLNILHQECQIQQNKFL